MLRICPFPYATEGILLRRCPFPYAAEGILLRKYPFPHLKTLEISLFSRYFNKIGGFNKAMLVHFINPGKKLSGIFLFLINVKLVIIGIIFPKY